MIKMGLSFEPPNATAPTGPLRVGFAAFKANFFDRARVQGSLSAALREKLPQIGAIVRTIAQRSMRRRAKASKPGEPPSARTDNWRGGWLREKIQFAWDGESSVIIGPEALNRGKSVVPLLHELGGQLKNSRRKTYAVGGVGPVKMQSWQPGTKHARRQENSPGKPWVIYAHLKTSRALRNAEKIDEKLYGPRMWNYPARPYMKPAMLAAREKYAKLFENSVR